MMSADDILSGGKSSRQISEEKVHVDHGLMRRLHLLDETFGDDFFYLSQSTVCMKCVYRDHRWLQQFCSSSVQSIVHIQRIEMSRHLKLCPEISNHLRPSPEISRHVKSCPEISNHAQRFPVISNHVKTSYTMSKHFKSCP